MDDALATRSAAATNNPQEPLLAHDLAVGRRVIRAEIDGLRQLAEALDGAFGIALDLCAEAAGRVIVTGIGKSGHVARKIAATFASTGTPAQFVHPAEASHGDLGMIGAGDVVIALSNSGNSAELGDIVAYSRRFKIPLVAVTGDRRSTLAEAADVVMLLPGAAEACSMGLTPTTSTTMMLALGDALAVALLERKGFSTADFQLFHPGGSIGRKLLRVSDIMHTGDLRRHMNDRLFEQTVTEIMHAEPKTIGAAGLAAEALGVMNRFSITALFVVDEAGRPLGFLHMHDCLRAGVA
jgi:arabinose-5-phosphate isomerase